MRSDPGPSTWRAERLKSKAGQSVLVGGGLSKQGNLLMRPVVGDPQDD